MKRFAKQAEDFWRGLERPRRNSKRLTWLTELHRRFPRLDRKAVEQVEQFGECAVAGDRARLRRLYRRLLEGAERPEFVLRLLEILTQDDLPPLYVAGSAFLRRCHRYLAADPQEHEVLHFVTGIQLGRLRILDQLVGVDLEAQSPVYARADQGAVHRALLELEELGHEVHGLFHVHPGSGAGSTHPSGTDHRTHERYERGGYPLIGAIFSRDGFVRFFSHEAPFEVAIYGKGVTKRGHRLFQI